MKRYDTFEAADWQRIEHDWTAWWHGEIDRPMIVIEAMTPGRHKFERFFEHITTFPLTASPDEIIDTYVPQYEDVYYLGDAFPKWWPNFGPGVVAAFLGSRVDASTGTTWFHPAGLNSLAGADLVYSPADFWWQRVQAVTCAALDRWGDRMVIGCTDLGGNLDILASLRGTQQLLMDVVDEPVEVERLLRRITSLWLRYYDEFYDLVAPIHRGTSHWSPLWALGRSYMLQSDFSYMISPAMFERLVLPDLTACCDALDYAFYHLDGKGEIKHLDLLLSIDRLRGIQWIPGDGAPLAEDWLPLLKRIRDRGKLCQLFVSPAGALKIARELGGKGFAFCLTGSNGFLTPDDALAGEAALRAEGLLD